MKKNMLAGSSYGLPLLFLLFIGLFLFTEAILNVTPPITRDALIHHLAIPKIWLHHQTLHPIPWSNFSYYPMNIQLLYMVCLWIGSDILPKFIHMLFGLGCGFLIFKFIKDRLGKIWGLLGFSMFLSLPVVVWLSTAAYVDLGLTFFTTASMIYLIRFQWDNPEQINNLACSAICMGVALGIKYNALIVFAFFNIAIFYMTYNNTHTVKKSIIYTLIFFLIASVIASPWFIRNAIHTGNPFYPLFNSVFHHISDITEHPLYCTDMAPVFSLSSISIRKILFNESFFETVTIPIRMFFEGNDSEYQYFQGQLNPMLILFVPFILQPATRQSWMKIMAAFIFFYGYVAFFTTMHQVRYLLPILPFLCILSVYGLHGLFHMIQSSKSHLSTTGKYCVLTLLVVLFSLNIKYLCNHFQRIDPFPYISKKESRVDYLRRHLGHYQSFEYINAHLPDNSRILTLFLGQRGYYLDRVYKHEPLFGMNVIQCMVKKSHSEASFKEYIDQMDITHILTRNDILTNYLNDRFAQSDRQHLNRCVQKFFHQVMSFDNYTLWGRVETP